MDMDKSTAELIERITTERETLRHELEEAQEYIRVLKDIIKTRDNHIEYLDNMIDEMKEENRQR